MPEITELLEQAAPGAGGPAPFDDIVRRGRRRKVATRAAAVGAPLAVVVVVAVIMTGGSPTGVVIDPPPPMAETPDPDPTPQPTPSVTDGETGPESAPETAGEVGTVSLGDLGVEVFVVGPTESAFGDVVPRVDRHRPGSTTLPLEIEAGFPGAAGLVPDGEGGFAWQPDWQSAEPAPVLHHDRRGEVHTLFEADADQTLRLVGPHDGTRAVLVSVGSGNDFDTATADLVSVPFDGGEPEVLVEGIGAWEQGVKHAVAVGDTVLYGEWVEAMERVVVRPAEGEPVVLFEGGELSGEYVRGVAVSAADDLGLVLVTGTADDGRPTARLISIHLSAGEVVGESDVPLDDADVEGFAPARATDLSTTDRYFLVSREFEGERAPAVVYDIARRGWATIRADAGADIAGRAFLAAPASGGATPTAAPCATEDEAFRMAPPNEAAGAIWQWVPCIDGPTPDVYRVAAFEPQRATLEGSLTAALDRLVELPLADEHLERGYVSPRMDQTILLHGVTYDDGHVVVDLGYPDGAGPLGTTSGGSVWHHALLGTTMQFSAVETVELRRDGSCVDHQVLFEGAPDACQVFDRSAAPWNLG
jgi:hypothetical protein